MSITVALTHRTSYTYDRPVRLSPHVIRLRPAPHSRSPVLSYVQKVSPKDHFVNWQQDPFANWNARVVFPEKVDHFEVTIDLIARMDAINPFDFFLEEDCLELPWRYDPLLAKDLGPYLVKPEIGPRLAAFLKDAPKPEGETIPWVVSLNTYVQQAVAYIVRMEPGVQTAEETLERGKGSCRDSGWLLVQMFRAMGFAARFVSGYLIQLRPDMSAPGEPEPDYDDFTDLHAWAEVYLPGAGWVGLDATSGLFAGEGHIPLAATPEPRSAAPITGALEPCEVSFDFGMSVTRLKEPARVTKPMTDVQWAQVLETGDRIDARMQAADMRLTMGGEPTFVSAVDRDAGEWTVDAVGPTKRAHAEKLIRGFQRRFAPDGLLHFGQGKWYPGEQLPRWAFALYWRGDGEPLWLDPELIAPEHGPGTVSSEAAGRFAGALSEALGIDAAYVNPAYEDIAAFVVREQQLPDNIDPLDAKLDEPEERARLARVFGRGLGEPSAFVLPIQLAQSPDRRVPRQRRFRWASDRWATRRGKLFLIPGDSPAGFRLPLQSLTWLPEEARPEIFERDPMSPDEPLPPHPWADPEAPEPGAPGATVHGAQALAGAQGFRQGVRPSFQRRGAPEVVFEDVAPGQAAMAPAVRTALTVEPRGGTLCIFLPPVPSAEAYVDLVAAVEETAAELGQPVHVEGYPPPSDHRLNVIKVTPDPGVIEVNIHPARNWREQVAITETVYEEARQAGLDASSFQIDGRPTGSGGGNHIVVGGASPADSPFLRRPDLLGSLIAYWQRHPSLSYLFSGLFIGPTSQAPRIDEARMETLEEMAVALAQLPPRWQQSPPWLVDRLFRDLLVDVTGNTHRAEICIDKMFSPDGPTGRLGLVEFRAFEMPPHARMSCAQTLVLRALLAWFWETPYTAPLIEWGPRLHDRYMLPHFVWEDFRAVLADLTRAHGTSFDPEWFRAQYDFRFAHMGTIEIEGVSLELRMGLEPWNVLGEDGTASGTARYVDSSVERIQVGLSGPLPEGLALAVNGFEVPLSETPDGGRVAGVRFRAWQPPRCLHPTIPAQGPLVFDVVERDTGRSRGGCTYHVVHPGGRARDDRPINALEAEGRRLARFDRMGHSPGRVDLRRIAQPPGRVTLDLRRAWLGQG
ncbi:transglutaminase family protein [Paralimibaculum aggregatum]|uniref:Transglutaminase family protein n=1 Tax=Paralimibaculum aggregatum TaxID=3036245 RepID=A0ABQ6LU01_9RHOB|nr:transglutaminase family protein [Limibaculum sp. NKW23]GMG85578.1 transglutaminase family protein [Limibaculum sp. NKW23]